MSAVYVVPAGVIGLQGTTATWARLDRGDPPTATLVSGVMEIRLYRYDLADLDDLTAASLGIVVLRPGAVVPVEDDFTEPPGPPDADLTTARRRQRRRSPRRRPR